MRSIGICLLALVAAVSSFVFTFPSTVQDLDEKCCVSCSLPLLKYYTVRNQKCGEACIDPKNYTKVKIFEPSLAKAESNTPCIDNQFTVYNTTETHGAGSLKVSLDMYIKPA